jgi:hypothetical protein
VTIVETDRQTAGQDGALYRLHLEDELRSEVEADATLDYWRRQHGFVSGSVAKWHRASGTVWIASAAFEVPSIADAPAFGRLVRMERIRS